MEKNNIVIRKAGIEDIPGLVKNRMEFIYSLKNIIPPKTFEDRTTYYLNQQIKGNNFVAWIAEDGDKIVSACMLCITEQIPTPICPNGKSGYIYNVFTQKEYRGHGIATNLLKEMQKYAIELGVLSVRLQATGDGFPVYQQIGFKVQTNEMLWMANACPAK